MSAFWIFATCLTVVYIIYYSVIICKDLARPREQSSSAEETFVLDASMPEPSKVVAMTDKGFQVDDGSGNVKVQEITDIPSRRQMEEDKADSDAEPKLDGTGAPMNAVEKKMLDAQEEMEPIDVSAASELVLDGMKEAMAGELPTINIERTVTSPEKSSGDDNAKKELDHDGGQRI